MTEATEEMVWAAVNAYMADPSSFYNSNLRDSMRKALNAALARMPTQAYAFPNGMLVVFDVGGNQVPAYQGRTQEMLPKLREDWPRCVVEASAADGPPIPAS